MLRHATADTQFGADLIEAMKEVVAWKCGEITLTERERDPEAVARALTPPSK